MAPKYMWTFVGVFTALLLVGLQAVWTHRLKGEVKSLQAEVAATQAKAEQNLRQAETLRAQIEQKQAQLESLRQEHASTRDAQLGLEAEMRRALESKDVAISELQGKLTVNILDRILFDSGEATLKPEGEAVLRKVAEVLVQFPQRRVHVVGHTDNVPIRASARNKFSNNWELSMARAMSAVRFLSEHAGVDPHRLGAVGYGEFRPLADNATPEGRARNRRIAIVVLADELVGADVPIPSSVAAPATNTHPNVPAVSVSTNDLPADLPPPPVDGP
jgi:chemotaxis protein MotB